jgi:hypothetical protein
MRKRIKSSKFTALVFTLILLPYLTISSSASKLITYYLHDHHDNGYHAHYIPETEIDDASNWHDKHLHSSTHHHKHETPKDEPCETTVPKSSFFTIQLAAAFLEKSFKLQTQPSVEIELPKVITLSSHLGEKLKNKSTALQNVRIFSNAPPINTSHVTSILLSNHAILI